MTTERGNPPCDVCGYNGPGYYQLETHPCMKKGPAMTTEERARELRLTVREVVNKLPIHLDTSEDLETAIELVSACVRAAQAETWKEYREKFANELGLNWQPIRPQTFSKGEVIQALDFVELSFSAQAEMGKEGG